MNPCISTIICLLDSPNTDCQYVEAVVGFAQRRDLVWELILILKLWDNLFISLLSKTSVGLCTWLMVLYFTIDSSNIVELCNLLRLQNKTILIVYMSGHLWIFSADTSNKGNLLMIPSFNKIMRFFLYVQILTEAGNDIVKEPSLLRNIE